MQMMTLDKGLEEFNLKLMEESLRQEVMKGL